jgi:putative ABC transport system ATP-binding protein
MMNTQQNVLALKGISKAYSLGGTEFQALSPLDLEVKKGELIALTGTSGSGKSTLLNILGCLDISDTGSYHLDGQLVSGLEEDQLAVVRNRKIGFVFQNFNLIPRMSSWENVARPLVYRGVPPKVRKAMALEALKQVGLEQRSNHQSNELSGGQRQRVAIARALIGQPEILLADEPTGNLDSRTASDIMGLLKDLHRAGRTLIIVTHENEIAKQCQRIIRLHDGQICEDSLVAHSVKRQGEVFAPLSEAS